MAGHPRWRLGTGLDPGRPAQAHALYDRRRRVGRRRPEYAPLPADPLGSLVVVLVVAAPPHAVFVAAEWRGVEPLVHAPQDVQSAPVGRVGVVHGAVLQGESAHARPLTPVGFPVRADDRLAEGIERALGVGRRPEVLVAEVVRNGARRPLLLGNR